MSQTASLLAEARQLFAEAGLPFPFIPPEMAGAIRRVSEWVYGTRTEAGNLYSIARFVQEAGTAPVADYLLFGHAGHGINSHAIHCLRAWERG